MRRFKIGFVALAWLVLGADLPALARPAPAPAPAASAESVRGYLRAAVVRAQQQTGVPGLVAALVDEDELVAESAGLRAAAPMPPRAFLPTDRVHLGSCFKAMTATVCARLVEKGRLRWDSTLAEVFPDIAPTMHPDFRVVTITDLLSHRSGLSDSVIESIPPSLQKGSGRQVRARVFPLLLRDAPANPRGTYEYSNAGYALVGAMIEKISGEAFEAVVSRELTGPLGITTLKQGAPSNPKLKAPDQPRGHDAEGKPQLPPQEDDPVSLAPAGTFSMSIADWAKFVRIHMGLPAAAPGYITSASLTTLHTPVGGPMDPEQPGDSSDAYALGWGVLMADGETHLAHTGSNNSWLSAVEVNPRTKRAFLYGSNQLNTGDAAAIIISTDPVLRAWLNGKPLPELADVTGQTPGSGPDGVVDTKDLFSFLTSYATGSAGADLVGADSLAPGDGVIDEHDLLAFFSRYLARR
jgi:CubicO group peptidase (beta-lactamase class C family)